MSYNNGASVPVIAASFDPAHEVFGGGDDVEGRGNSVPVLKERHPQVAPGELPLRVGPFLRNGENYCSFMFYYLWKRTVD